MRSDGSKLPNVFASGGAAVGVSGTGVDGYLSGNGLLTAVTWAIWPAASLANKRRNHKVKVPQVTEAPKLQIINN